MAAVILRLSETTLDRLTTLAEGAGVDVDTVVSRLLDRDPHEHSHACPTCRRMASTTQARLDQAQTDLFAELAPW